MQSICEIFLQQYSISYIENTEKADNFINSGLRFGVARMTEDKIIETIFRQ